MRVEMCLQVPAHYASPPTGNLGRKQRQRQKIVAFLCVALGLRTYITLIPKVAELNQKFLPSTLSTHRANH